MRKGGTGPVHAVTVRLVVLRNRVRQAVRAPGREREDLLLRLTTVAARPLSSGLPAPGRRTGGCRPPGRPAGTG